MNQFDTHNLLTSTDTGSGQVFLSGKPAHGFLPKAFALWMTAIYVGLFIIRPWEVMFPQLTAINFERLFAIFMVLCVMLTCGFRFRWNLQNGAVAMFIGALGLSSIRAWNAQAASEALYVYLTLLVCYCVLVSVIRSLYDLLFIIGAYIGFMELYLGKALWEYFINGRCQHAMGVTRLIGIEDTFGHPNAVASSIVLSLPLWLFLWKCRREILAGWSAAWNKLVVWGLAIYPVIAVLGILLTNSRSGMIELVVFAILWSLQGKAKGRMALNIFFALAILAIGWMTLPEEQKNRIKTIWDPSINTSAEEAKQGRFDAIRAALEIFKQYPITGVGPGNFILYRTQYVDGVKLDPHNLIGQMLAETGLLGAGAFVFVVAATLINVRMTRSMARGQSESNLLVLESLVVACRDSIILLFVGGLSGHNLYRFNWLWLGAFCSLAAEFSMQILNACEFDCEESYIACR
jgi:O-antigen ligase